MFKLSVQNQAGERIELTKNDNYVVKSVQGLNPAPATINTMTVTNFDGARFNSSRVDMRNIVVTILPMEPVDENRIKLYQYFKVKQPVRLFYSNRLRDVYIDGYVETMEDDFFTKSQSIQISIICPNPFFKSIDSVTDSFLRVVEFLESPMSLPTEGIEVSEKLDNYNVNATNNGDISTGIIIHGIFIGNVVELTIWDNTTTEKMMIEYEFLAGDELYINTNKGQKSITLYRSGEHINLINYLTDDSSWLALEPGINSFEYTTVYGQSNVELTIEHTDLYQGV